MDRTPLWSEDQSYLSSPLPFQKSTDSNSRPRFVSLIRHNHDRSSDHRGVLSISDSSLL